MTLVDWAVVIIMLAAVLAGMAQGFFRSICSLGGLVIGLAVAAWNYGRLAAILLPLVRLPAVAYTIAFLLIALLVMAAISLIGNLLAKAFKMIGLGWLDGIAGAIFGFFQGVVLVVVFILVIVAFFPQEQWLAESTLPRMFFGALHVSTHVTPSDLSSRVHTGLRSLEVQSPRWMHPGGQG
ncbi:MAG TPA: CvpA family protein [Terracidiphilus sp.]|jgi:membrane protein required for colicin V production